MNKNEITWWHRIKLSDGTYTPGIVKHGPDGGDWPTTRFGMPRDLTGKTVLDIGTWDGFFAFEAERRGAKVTAIDPQAAAGTPGFNFAKADLKSGVEFYPTSIESPLSLGTFDVVLFYGVLYHLKSPLIGLENACDAARELILVETAHSKSSGPAVLEYRPDFLGDVTNFFYPNIEFIKLVLERKGFAPEVIYNDGNRITVRGVRVKVAK